MVVHLEVSKSGPFSLRHMHRKFSFTSWRGMSVKTREKILCSTVDIVFSATRGAPSSKSVRLFSSWQRALPSRIIALTG